MKVALYTSAWIEISIMFFIFIVSLVALYTSAWIEIRVNSDLSLMIRVALYTSAWIEISSLTYMSPVPLTSHSIRVHGLKFYLYIIDIHVQSSHSIRVRGLKCMMHLFIRLLFCVALYTSAWIEIGAGVQSVAIVPVALYTSAWIEITPILIQIFITGV